MPVPSPLLRSPPFPWVSPPVAAVSTPGATPLGDPDAVLAAMRAARVGGAFWSEPDPWDAREVVAEASDERALIGWLAGVRVRDPAGGAIAEDALRAAAIAALAAARYRDPFTGAVVDAAAAVAILAGWRRLLDANRAVAATTGMAAWKREAMAQFLWDGRASPRNEAGARAVARARSGAGALAFWPSRTPPETLALAVRAGVPTHAVEDGFIRSAGLGAECRPPMSVLVDPTGGIYYDPARESLVERILATHDFDAALLARAARLRAAIVAARLGKYGVDRPDPPAPFPPGARVVLAIGQVEDDLSVLRGGGAAGPDGFLERVRAEEPDAFIVYRPHPDVVAGLRRGSVPGIGAVDRVAPAGSLFDLVEAADAVHVRSSLTGFEALIRGRPVTVHGAPFYAGWGLTRDLGDVPARRGRALPLDALVAGALILAPRYRDPETQLPCEPEVLVARLAATPLPVATPLTRVRRAIGATRRAVAG